MSAATGKTDATSTVIAGGSAHTTPEKPAAFLGEVGKKHTLRKSITEDKSILPTAEEILKEKEELASGGSNAAKSGAGKEMPPSGRVMPGGK